MQPLNAKKRKGGIEIEKTTQHISMLKPCTITTGPVTRFASFCWI